MSTQSSTYDVIIAGAGPVGLFLACELRLAGVSVLLLEQAADPRSPLKILPFGMRGLSTPTLEAFHRRGLLDQIVALQQAKDEAGTMPASAHWLQQQRRPAGHFAGIPFFAEDVDSTRWPYRLPSPAGFNLAVDMQSLEGSLTARAIARGTIIKRGEGVVAIEAECDGVTVQTQDNVYRTSWLVGCDGGRSRVRKLAGFDFAGTDPEFTGYSVAAELEDADKLSVGRTYTPTGMYTFARPGTIAMVDFDGGVFHRMHPVTREHVQSVLRRISGTDVTLTNLKFAATWTDRARQATSYRRGPVLLAGDAAHVHSPLGGQGLNLGLADAMNLGWKLAATIRGSARAGLIDSYHGERHPQAARVLDWSRAQVALMRPTPSTRALESIVRDLVATRDGATYFAEQAWGVSLRYDLGDDHPLVGRSVPDFELVGGARIGELLRHGRGLMLDFTSSAPHRSLTKPWRSRIDYICAEVKDHLGLSAILIRPDGFVACASDKPADGERFLEAMHRWFGAVD
ncbi:FAD-dependent monooxygenase [Sphingomonas sp. HF-S4]|uniref:FAD-dependent monooxygenase n=1 Tax=Sphingomonas agrestis TaxID=3080540 RepID=A0ABU3Y954_9SPHN|nr:FAD-dependent monooxygenase [Sphingomonas sp. HF-S4]MDV3457948.1 FAD-dependent monooxygenase [Sphingomonas sp. HF-S4]